MTWSLVAHTMLKHSKPSERSTAAEAVDRGATRVGRGASNATPQQAGLEVELKLGVATEHLDILKNHPLFRNRRSGRGELISIYLDTKDRALHRQGLSFRLRRKGEELLQTIKGPYQGIVDRSERETLFIRDKSDRPGAIDAFLRNLDRTSPTALKPVFKTRVERETFQIGGIEVCLDKGEIIAGRRSSSIAEVELELKSGDRAKLFSLARKISAIIPAEISVKSKSERGYDLVEGTKTRAIMAQDPVLSRFPTVIEAFQVVSSECLHQLISNLPGVRDHMAESLHQARVALRRLDAAVKVFRKIQSGRAAKIAGELKWISGELGDARELDVFMNDFFAPLRSKHPTDLSLAKVHDACVRLSEKAYERANAALSSQRFRTFLIDVAEWIETAKGGRKAKSRVKSAPSAKDLVSRTLSKMSRKMKAVKRIDELDLRGLHKLRLRAKRMRYTIEFTRNLYEVDRERIEATLKQLCKLQSALGKLTDMASARTILSRIVMEAKADPKSGKQTINSVLTTMAAGQESQNPQQIKKAAKAFEKLENLKPFWT